MIFVKINSVKKKTKKTTTKSLKLKPQVNHTIWINLALINKDKGVAQVRGALYGFLGIKHCFISALDPALNF